MPITPVVAVEIGTSKVITLVGELREDNHVMITGMGEQASTGVRKGEIIDFENASVCVRSSLSMAEESGKVTIRSVHLAISGGHIQSVVNRGTVPVLDRDSGITEDDVEEVMDVARAVNLPPDREVLHTICQNFCIDEQQHVVKPEGMQGAKLSLDMLVLHGIRNRLHNTVRVVRSIPVQVQDVVFGGLCSALSVLTPEQKKSGVVVIDFGGGTTDYVAYADSIVAAAGTLGVGGDHISNDLVLAFNIPMARAERLKRDSGRAVVDAASAGHKVSLPAEVGFPGRTFGVKALNTVISARVEEILLTIKKRLEADEILGHVGAGIVLTGGGAHLRDIDVLAQRVFGVPCSIGKPRNVSGLATATGGPEYAGCSGLVQYGFRPSRTSRPGTAIGNWLRNLFRR